MSTYDGTPTGNEFTLDGKRVGDGWDQHFGAAESNGATTFSDGKLVYPVESSANPDGSGRRIHNMKARGGEIWFEYAGEFTLDPTAGTLVGTAIFDIVGGTGRFGGSTGWVSVVTQTSLADVFPDENGNLNAPFRYDFDGWIKLKRGDDDD